MRNPHFEDGLVVWSDEYSGRYQAPLNGYAEEFDLKWALCLTGDKELGHNPGASVEASYIADRIYEWTGVHPADKYSYDASSGTRPLDHPLDVDLIRGKSCIDIGCGLGRWTKTMLALGASSVLSVDMSIRALESVKSFNPNVLQADVTQLAAEHAELTGKFDFANLWGVAMSTHDPLQAFLSAAATVKDGGALYLMVYAPEGIHGTAAVNLRRKRFAQLPTVEEKLAYVDVVYDRRWDFSVTLFENLKNQLRKVSRRPKGARIGTLDMLEPFYNWVIPLDIIQGWMRKGGFAMMKLLNERETKKCAYHVLLIKRG